MVQPEVSVVHAYFNPSSICSHKVLLTLYEGGVSFVPHSISLGKLEQYDPEYAVINPKMVVPSLVVADPSKSVGQEEGKETDADELLKEAISKAVTRGIPLIRSGKDGDDAVHVVNDSADIIQYIAKHLATKGHSLLCDSEDILRHNQLDKLMRAFPTVLLSFGILTHPELMYDHDPEGLKTAMKTSEFQKLVADVPRHRDYMSNKVPHLQNLCDEYPQLKSIYEQKIEYVVNSYLKCDESTTRHAISEAEEATSALEKQLELQAKKKEKSSDDQGKEDVFLLSNSTITLIDIPWAVILHRIVRLGLTDRLLTPYPRVHKYYKTLAARDAFQKVLNESGF